MRFLQRQAQGRTPERRDLLKLSGGQGRHRAIAHQLQYKETAFRPGIPSASTRPHGTATRTRRNRKHAIEPLSTWYKMSVRPVTSSAFATLKSSCLTLFLVMPVATDTSTAVIGEPWSSKASRMVLRSSVRRTSIAPLCSVRRHLYLLNEIALLYLCMSRPRP